MIRCSPAGHSRPAPSGGPRCSTETAPFSTVWTSGATPGRSSSSPPPMTSIWNRSFWWVWDRPPTTKRCAAPPVGPPGRRAAVAVVTDLHTAGTEGAVRAVTEGSCSAATGSIATGRGPNRRRRPVSCSPGPMAPNSTSRSGKLSPRRWLAARDLVLEPAAAQSPDDLAARFAEVATAAGASVEVLGRARSPPRVSEVSPVSAPGPPGPAPGRNRAPAGRGSRVAGAGGRGSHSTRAVYRSRRRSTWSP